MATLEGLIFTLEYIGKICKKPFIFSKTILSNKAKTCLELFLYSVNLKKNCSNQYSQRKGGPQLGGGGGKHYMHTRLFQKNQQKRLDAIQKKCVEKILKRSTVLKCPDI